MLAETLSINPASVEWPKPWKPITNESDALAFGRQWNPQVSPTVLAELRRETGPGHRLHGVDCQPLVSDGRKEFLFATDQPKSPVVLVHFTWHSETDPRWPATVAYASLREFLRKERQRTMKFWELWKLFR